jgi:hypothetical protein
MEGCPNNGLDFSIIIYKEFRAASLQICEALLLTNLEVWILSYLVCACVVECIDYVANCVVEATVFKEAHGEGSCLLLK